MNLSLNESTYSLMFNDMIEFSLCIRMLNSLGVHYSLEGSTIKIAVPAVQGAGWFVGKIVDEIQKAVQP